MAEVVRKIEALEEASALERPQAHCDLGQCIII